MKFAVGISLILLCVLGLYLAGVTRTPEPQLEAPALSSIALREQPLEPLSAHEGRGRTPLDGQAPALEPPAQTPSAAPAFVDVRVVVLSRDDQRPLEKLEVQLAWWSIDGDSPSVQGTTDAAGAVSLRLDAGGTPRENLCTVTVGQGDGARRFNAIPLRDEIVVLMDTCTRLHGRIVPPGVAASERAWVQIEEARHGTMSCGVMLARAQADADGTFEMQACPARELPLVDVRVMLEGLAVTRSIRWQELASEAGARIELSFGELLVRVQDADDSAIAGAELRIASLPADGAFPTVAKSDVRGEYRAKLEIGSFEVIAAAPGFSSTIERVEFEGQASNSSLTLVLRRLGDDDRLVGRVVLEDGTPVEGAWVTANPVMDSPDAAMAGHAQLRSGADGSFELAIATDRELEVVAYRRDLGMSAAVRIQPGNRRLELVICAQGKLEVRISPPSGLAAFSGGLVEYALVDRRLAHFDFGHAFEVPFVLEQLPIGDYNLFVYIAGWNAYAEGSVHVEANLSTQVELASHTAQFARGRVRLADESSLSGGTLRMDHPTWPPEVESLWSSPLSADGRFELFLGEETACPATLLRRPAASCSVQVHAGDGQDFVIP